MSPIIRIELREYPPGLGYPEHISEDLINTYAIETCMCRYCPILYCTCYACKYAVRGCAGVCKRCGPCIWGILTHDCTCRLIPYVIVVGFVIYIITILSKIEEHIATQIERTASEVSPF